MNMMMNIYKIFSISVLSLALSACGFFDVPPQVIPAEEYYQTKEDVFNGMTGVYGVMSNEPFYGNYYSLMCSNVDDLCKFNRSSTTNYTNIYTHDAGTTEIYGAWTEIYKGIRNANFFLSQVPAKGLDPEGRYTNEVKFLRAYYYFILGQAWGNVPLRTLPTESYENVACAASSQYKVLEWAARQMEECVSFYDSLYVEHPEYEMEDLNAAPSRVCRNTVHGILARVYLFMAGESVTIEDPELSSEDFYAMAKEHAWAVIDSGHHSLNPDYSQVFKNMMSDKYDRTYRESIWEVDFMGDRSSSGNWSNGRIGDLLGLQSSGSSNFEEFKCNFAYGQYDGTQKLWDLYWTEDRTTAEKSNKTEITDLRQLWNMPPYNYAGLSLTEKVNGKDTVIVKFRPSLDTTYYSTVINKERVYAKDNPTIVQDRRNCGKFRREVEYEGVMDAKRLYTCINFPILRYSDVLLMYVEAALQSEEVHEWKYLLMVRERDTDHKVSTEQAKYASKDAFLQLIKNERARELCFEATRKYDLIRWGEFETAMADYEVQPKHVLLPIPSIELGVNRELKQNPGW